jgi:hypothetical protein
MSKPRFQIETLWPDGRITKNSATGDGFMFPDAVYRNAWLYDGDQAVLGFSIEDGSKDCFGRRTIIRIV